MLKNGYVTFETKQSCAATLRSRYDANISSQARRIDPDAPRNLEAHESIEP